MSLILSQTKTQSKANEPPQMSAVISNPNFNWDTQWPAPARPLDRLRACEHFELDAGVPPLAIRRDGYNL
jgi:hypothetical protein